jgi:hypothetical protein
MSRSIRRRWFGVPALAAAILCTVLVGTAFAAGNTLKVGVPSNAHVGKQFSLTIRGHAAKKEGLFLFLDVFRCASTPAAEHARHAPGPNPVAVKGKFDLISKHWVVKKAIKVHACAYLVKLSNGAVIVHSFASFRVH